jgi:hypothetical protein
MSLFFNMVSPLSFRARSARNHFFTKKSRTLKDSAFVFKRSFNSYSSVFAGASLAGASVASAFGSAFFVERPLRVFFAGSFSSLLPFP